MTEDRLALIESLLLQTAQSQRTGQEQLDRMQDQLDQTQQHLDRVDRLVEANAQAIADNTRQITANNQNVRRSFEDVAQWITDLINQAEEHRSFIRGLQMENRRILDELRDRRQGD